MKRIIKLTESDLIRIVKRVIKEQLNQDVEQFENPYVEKLLSKMDEIDKNMESLINSGRNIDKGRFLRHLRKSIESVWHENFSNENISRKQFRELNRVFSNKIEELYNKYRKMLN